MTTRETKPWLDVLASVQASKDAPAHLRAVAKEARDLYAKATAIHDAATAVVRDQRDALDKAIREQLPTALDDLRERGTVDLDAKCRYVEAMREQLEKVSRECDLADTVVRRITSYVCGGCFTNDHDTLLQWIATRRNSEPTTCGPFDAIPEQLQHLYRHLRADWHLPFDDELTMHDHRRLVLIYDDTYSEAFRASHAWLWDQVARGEIERLANGRIRATRRVSRLPDVPAAAPAPPRPTVRAF